MRKKSYSKAEVVLFALVAIQILFLFVFNLTRIDDAVNFDTVEYLTQVMQIWKQKTILIQDYYYSTMLTWDMSTLLAVPFYGVTGNVYLAWGMANNVLILLFIFLLAKLCKDLEYSRFTALFIFLCVFSNYQWGYIDYIEELFINGALYGFRLLFMLIFMDLLVCIYKNKTSVINFVLCILGVIGMFLCGASTGIFAIGCCIAPLFLAELWMKLIDREPIRIKSFVNKPIILLGVAIVVSLIGVVTSRCLGLSESISTQKNIISSFEMSSNFHNAIVGIFELFGWPNLMTPSITSVSGVLAIVAAGFALCFIGTLLLQVYLACFKRTEVKSIHYRYIIYVTFIMFVNLALFTFVDLSYSPVNFEYRYWVIVFIPAFVGIGVVFEWLQDKVYDNVKKCFLFLFIVILSVVSFGKDYSRYKFTDANDTLRYVMNQVAQYDLDEVFLYSDWTWSREMLAFQTGDAEYFAVYNYGTDNDGTTPFENRLTMSKWGNYAKYDGDCLEMPKDKAVGIVINDFAGEDKQFLRARAKEIVSIDQTGFELYIMDQNYMDFVWGVPEPEAQNSIDYFNWGYIKDAFILNENGKYESNGASGSVLKGEFVSNQVGTFSAEMQYNISETEQDECGLLRITVSHADGTSTVYETVLKEYTNNAKIESFSLLEGDVYTVELILNEGVHITLDEMNYSRL